eukprot:4302750-Pyramimonas_sp.AAC.1
MGSAAPAAAWFRDSAEIAWGEGPALVARKLSARGCDSPLKEGGALAVAQSHRAMRARGKNAWASEGPRRHFSNGAGQGKLPG